MLKISNFNIFRSQTSLKDGDTNFQDNVKNDMEAAEGGAVQQEQEEPEYWRMLPPEVR